MADRAALQVHLMFAKALSVSEPFDATNTFKLLQRISKEAKVPMRGFMREATRLSLSAASDGEVHSSAIARYALKQTIIVIEARLRAKAL